MLVLSRKAKQQIVLGDGLIIISVVELRKNVVRIGIEAPGDVPILVAESVRKQPTTGSLKPGTQVFWLGQDSILRRGNFVDDSPKGARICDVYLTEVKMPGRATDLRWRPAYPQNGNCLCVVDVELYTSAQAALANWPHG